MSSRVILDDHSPEPATLAEAEGLDAILVRRRWVWGWFFATIPVACVAGVLSVRVLRVVMPMWMGAWAILILRHAFARCPRRGGYFNWTWYWSNPFTRQCMHCNLRILSAAELLTAA